MKHTLMLSLAALWVADTFFTIKFVGIYGSEAEANVIMRYVIEHYDYLGFVYVKVATILLWGLVGEKAHWGIHVALNVLMLPVVYMGYQMAFN